MREELSQRLGLSEARVQVGRGSSFMSKKRIKSCWNNSGSVKDQDDRRSESFKNEDYRLKFPKR